jgi:excisionase family DNA binding protein
VTILQPAPQEPVLPDEPLLKVSEVARIYCCDETTIYRRIESGELPAIRLGDKGAYRIRLSEAAKFAKPAA